jgi:hypothetical protein
VNRILSYGHSRNRFVARALCVGACCESKGNRYPESEMEDLAVELDGSDESVDHFLETTSMSDFNF